MKSRNIQFLILLLFTNGCFSSGSQIPFKDPGSTTGSEGGEQSFGNHLTTSSGARSGLIVESVESENFAGVVMLSPVGLQGVVNDQGFEMMDPMMKVQRDSVDFIFGGD